MKTCISVAVLLAVVASGTPQTLTASEPLVMLVSSSGAFAPAILRVQLRIFRHADNRELDLTVDSGEFYRSSAVELDGERAPRVLTMEFADVPGGEYELRGVLLDGAGRVRAIARRTVIVIDSGFAP